MKYIKRYESVFSASEDDLVLEWEYYICSNCNSEFRVIKPKIVRCQFCKSKNVQLVNKDKQLV